MIEPKQITVTVSVTMTDQDGNAVDTGLSFPSTVTVEDQVAIRIPTDVMTIIGRATVASRQRAIARQKQQEGGAQQ